MHEIEDSSAGWPTRHSLLTPRPLRRFPRQQGYHSVSPYINVLLKHHFKSSEYCQHPKLNFLERYIEVQIQIEIN